MAITTPVKVTVGQRVFMRNLNTQSIDVMGTVLYIMPNNVARVRCHSGQGDTALDLRYGRALVISDAAPDGERYEVCHVCDPYPWNAPESWQSALTQVQRCE